MKSQSCIFVLFATNIIYLIGGCSAAAPFNNVTDSDIRQVTEDIFSDENRELQDRVYTNLQSLSTTKRWKDIAPEPLLKVDPEVLKSPLIKQLEDLFDDYELDTRVAEVVTPEEVDGQEKLLDDMLKTKAVIRTMNFLSDRGFLASEGNKTHKDVLRDLWFTQFPRQKKSKVLGSSAFEHIFLGELKEGKKLIGIHNWIFFNAAERDGRLNYWGYRSMKHLGNSTASVVGVIYSYSGKTKWSTMFIGTSPELELSLYTLCYFVRPNRYCRISLGGTKLGIQTNTINHTGSGSHLGTGFPVI